MRVILAALLGIATLHAQQQAVNIAYVGDSYTWGYQDGAQQVQNYPALANTLLHPFDVSVKNLGHSGQVIGPKGAARTMLTCGDAECVFSGTPPPTGTFPSTDSYISPGKYNVLVLEVAAPTINLSTTTAAPIYGYFTQYYSERKAAGWDLVIVAGDLYPIGGIDGATCQLSAIAHGVDATNAAPAPSICTCPAGGCNVDKGAFWGCCGVNQLLAAGQGVAWDVYLPLSTLAGFSNWDAPNTYKQSDNHWTVALNYIMAQRVAAKINTSWIFPMPGGVNGYR